MIWDGLRVVCYWECKSAFYLEIMEAASTLLAPWKRD